MALISSIATLNGFAISIRNDVAQYDYQALANSPSLSTVGAFVTNADGTPFCTGTIVGPALVLTASHCVDPLRPLHQFGFSIDPTHPDAVVASIARVVRHPLADIYDVNDLAFVHLHSSPSATWSSISVDDPLTNIGTFVGYGLHMDGTGKYVGYGTRLAAQNRIDNRFRGWIETDFDSPETKASTFGSDLPLPLEGSTGFGDSGAPLFVGTDLVGVLWGGYNPYGVPSMYGDVSQWIWVGAPSNIEFIKAHTTTTAPIPEPGTCGLVAIGFCIAVSRVVSGMLRSTVCWPDRKVNDEIGSPRVVDRPGVHRTYG
jgi:hypothetical protein